jgi:hypothetical protein
MGRLVLHGSDRAVPVEDPAHTGPQGRSLHDNRPDGIGLIPYQTSTPIARRKSWKDTA